VKIRHQEIKLPVLHLPVTTSHCCSNCVTSPGSGPITRPLPVARDYRRKFYRIEDQVTVCPSGQEIFVGQGGGIPLDKQPTLWGGLSLSLDETWPAYCQVDVASSDLMLVEGFR
jgi:hypothetical protein